MSSLALGTSQRVQLTEMGTLGAQLLLLSGSALSGIGFAAACRLTYFPPRAYLVRVGRPHRSATS